MGGAWGEDVVDVVIVTHRSAAVVAGCLEALPAAFPQRTYRIVVVDNASTDATISVVRGAAPQALVLEQPTNDGYAAAINAGVSALAGRGPVVILNPDARLRPGAGDGLVNALVRAGVGVSVPRMVDTDGRTHHSLRREPTLPRALGEAVLGGRRAGRWSSLGELVVDPHRYERAGVADWATGAVWAVGRGCLEATGEWDESFFLYSEETEYALRARERGWRLWYEPTAVAVHLGGSCATSPELWRLLAWNRVALYRRRRGPARGAAFRAAVILNEVLRGRDPVHRAAVAALLRRARPRVAGGPA